MIEEINTRFISTSTLVDDATKLADKGHPLAKTLAANWEYPVDIMFFTPEGQFVNKLNSFRDFKDVHAQVGIPPGKSRLHNGVAERSNADVFFDHVASHFGN